MTTLSSDVHALLEGANIGHVASRTSRSHASAVRLV